MEWERIISKITIKPIGEPIFSEQATEVYIEDEAAGPFVVIKQNHPARPGEISVDVGEWIRLREAIEQMINVCIQQEKH